MKNDLIKLDSQDNNQTQLQAVNLDAALFHAFTEYLDVKPSTLQTYSRSLLVFWQWLQDENIFQPQREDIIRFRDHLKSQYKPTTVKIRMTALRQFFKWTESRGLYPNVSDNVKNVTISKEPKKSYFTAQQVRKILKGIDRDNEKDMRDYALMTLLFTGGLRTIEVVRANRQDLSIRGNSTVLYVQGKGQDDKRKYIRVSEVAEQALRDYMAMQTDQRPDAALFQSTSNHNRGQRMTTRAIRGIVKERYRDAGFNDSHLTTHSARHTVAALANIGGASMYEIQQHLRHANISTTEIYLRSLEAENNPVSDYLNDAIFKDATS